MINRFLSTIILSCSLITSAFAEDVPVTPDINNVNESQKSEVRELHKPSSFADIVEPLIPTVVNIYSVQYNKAKRQPLNPFEGFPFDQFNNFFDQFNDNIVEFGDMYSNPKAIALGSGFIIDPVGYIVTNYHVIRNADEIYIKLGDNTELPAKLIGNDQKTDLALLKVESKQPLPFVKFGDSSKVRVGDWVIAVGNPFGLGGTVTSGIISAKSRDISDDGGVVDDFIQTDAAINTGNSGGPLFNIDGDVIGVNTAIVSPSGTNIGIGFAIPSSTAKNVIEQLKKYGKISRGKLDIKIQDITPEIAEGLGIKDQTGVLVVEVFPDGAADIAGLKPGDVIIEFNGQQIKNFRKLQVLVAEAPINQEVKIVVITNGEKRTLTVKINDKESEKTSSDLTKQGAITADKDSLILAGITFSDITDSLKQKFNLREKVSGVIITNVPKNQKSYGLKVGDSVLAINQQHITGIVQLKKVYEDAKKLQKKNVVLLVKRYNISIFIALPIE